MLGAYAFAVGLGLLVGLRYKVAAAVAGSAVVLCMGTVVFLAGGWPAGWALLAAFGASMAFQSGYFIGLGLTCVTSRTGIGLRPLGARHRIQSYERGFVDTHAPTR